MIDEALVERLARTIHELYVQDQLRRGATATPTMRPWPDLYAEVKEANRAQARDIEAKLAMIGCAIGPHDGAAEAFGFTDAEIDLLAQHEHLRWVNHRIAAGWSFGPVHDDEARHDPGLVAWHELPEAEKDKDRDAVRHVPAVLATAGLRPIRTQP